MTIRFKCPNPSCQKALTVKDELAGRKAPCPSCKTTLTIPRPKVPAPAGPAGAGPAPAADKPRPAAKPKAPVAAPVAPPPDLEDLAAAALAGETAPPPAEKPEADGKAGAKEAAPIVFKCEFCDTELKVPAAEAGKKIQCTNPDCRLLVKVPVPKVEKKDWRPVAQTGPSFARRAEPEKLAGVQGGEVQKVSLEALEEAGAIPDEEEPVTLGERIKFIGLWIVLPLCVLVGGYLAWNAFAGRSAQRRALDAALVFADVKTPKLPPLLAAEIQRGAGAFQLREGKAATARDHFANARSLAQQSQAGGVGRDRLLIELALDQVGLGGDDRAVIDGAALEWDPPVATELQQTLNQLQGPEARADGLRTVGWKLVQKKQEGIALSLRQLDPNGPHAAAMQFAAGQAKQAEEQFPPPKQGEQVEGPTRVAYAEGRALEGNFDQARAEAKRPGPALERLEASLAVAAAAVAQDKDDAAKTNLEDALAIVGNKATKNVPPQLQAEAARLAACVGLAGAKALADALADKDARAAAGLELLRGELRNRAKLGTTGDMKQLADEYVKEKETLSYALAVEAVARHNTRLGHAGEVQEALEGLDESLRPFAQLGVALGLQDRAK